MSKEAMKLALEALKSCDAAHITDGGRQWYDEKLVDKAVEAIEKALASEAKEQPAQSSKPWAGLTDEQWQSIADTLGCIITRGQKDAIEATIGIKGDA